MSNIKEVLGKPIKAACLYQPIIWSMAAILRYSVVAAAVVRARPRVYTASHNNHEKSTHEFPFVPRMRMGRRLVTLPAAGAPQ